MKCAAFLAAVAMALLMSDSIGAAGPDPRLREVVYDAHAVVTVPVRRGVVTLVLLDPDETIAEVAAGLVGGGHGCAAGGLGAVHLRQLTVEQPQLAPFLEALGDFREQRAGRDRRDQPVGTLEQALGQLTQRCVETAAVETWDRSWRSCAAGTA